MKAQRRHELRENELARVIKGAPSFWQQSGGKLLAGLIAVLVIALLINFRIRSNRQSREQAIQGLSAARSLNEELRSQAIMSAFAPPQEASLRRKQFFNEANNVLGDVTRLTDDRTLTSEALLARGDLNWTLATLPEIPGAATQPTLAAGRKELLDAADDAYRAVTESYADNKPAYFAARFSLAAIAEERGDWDNAKALYEKLVEETRDQPAYQQLAANRLRILPQLREAVVLAKPTTMPLLPPLISAATTTTATTVPTPTIAPAATTQRAQ